MKKADIAKIAKLLEKREQTWRILPGDDIIIMGAESHGKLLTLYLAGPLSNESLQDDFAVELIDEIRDGLIVIWCAIDVFELPRGTTETEYQPWMLVRDDTLPRTAPSA